MTVVTETIVDGPYTPNGVTTSFPVTFYTTDGGAVEVVIDDVIVGSGYVFSRDSDGTGTVVFAVPPTGTALYIRSDPSFTQDAEFTRFGPYFPDQLNDPLDAGVARDQWLRGEIARALKVPFGEMVPTLPTAADRANRLLAFDADGDPVAAPGSVSVPAIAAAIETATGGNVQDELDALNAGGADTARQAQGISQTATITAYDDFDRSNRILNGDTAPSGQAWQVLGAGAASVAITDRRMYDPAGKNFYAALPLGGQPRRFAVRYRWEPTGLTPTDPTKPAPQMTLILTANPNGITNNSAVHLQIVPDSITLDTFAGGTPTLGAYGINNTGHAIDGSEYQVAVELNADATQVTIIGPHGERTVASVPGNAGFTSTYFALQITDQTGLTFAALPRFLGLVVGEENRTNLALAQGSPPKVLIPSKGVILGNIKDVPPVTVTGNGPFRIASGGSFLGVACEGAVILEALQPATGLVDYVEIKASVSASSQSLVQDDSTRHGSGLIAAVVGSHDGTGSAAIDVTLAGASALQPVQFRYRLIGAFGRRFFPASGATPYTFSTTLIPFTPALTRRAWTITTSGWTRIAFGSVSYQLVGGLFLRAFDTAGRHTFAQIAFGGNFDSGPSMTKVSANDRPGWNCMSGARISRDGSNFGPTGTVVDVNLPNAGSNAVSLFASLAPESSVALFPTPATNVSALATAMDSVTF